MNKNRKLHKRTVRKTTNMKFISFVATLLVLCSTTMIAFADTDPVAQVNNFQNHLGSLISAAGGIALLVGIVILAQGLVSHDPSQKMTGGIIAAAGILLASAPFVVNNWFAASINMLSFSEDYDIASVINSINLF